jgi:hypothetical protein
MVWCSKDHRGKEGDYLQLWSWWLKGFLTFPGGEPKDTLVDCSWLVWSSSCVGCVAPYWWFDMWCQLACEPPSEWITTMRTSLPASKQTSVKILCHLVSRFLGFHCDWLAPSIDWHTPWYGAIKITSLSCIYISSVVTLFSVISFES